MNGELAQIIALITYGNEFLSRSQGEAPELFPSHSTFQYVSDISFKRETTRLGLFRRTEILATDTRNWFTTLRELGVKKLWLAFLPEGRRVTQHVSPVFGQAGGAAMWLAMGERAIPQYMAAGLAGGGDWVIHAESGKTTELWRPIWSVKDLGQVRRWSVEYWGIAKSPAQLKLPDLHEAMNNFEDALNAAATFSEEANLVYWSDKFAEVVEHLHDPEPAIPYFPELLPPTFDALICRQLLAGACKAWVFGAMGSWNDDVGCQGPENHAISSRLYQALMCAIAAATNSNGERSPVAASAVAPGATRSSEHKIAPARDMAYWLRRLQGDRYADAVRGLVQFGAPGIAELLSSMERSYARVDELLKEALRHVDAQAMLLELVRHQNGFVRAQVLVLLAELAAGEPAVTEASRKALHDPDEHVRTVAVQSLRKSGPHAGDVVPELVALMQKDPSDSVCIEAMRALADISPAGAAALRQAQEDDDPRMRDLYTDAFRKRSRRQQNQRE